MNNRLTDYLLLFSRSPGRKKERMVTRHEF